MISKEQDELKRFLDYSINNYDCFNIKITPIENKYKEDIPHKAFLVSFDDIPNNNIRFSKEFYVLDDEIFYDNEAGDSIEEIDDQKVWLWLLENATTMAEKTSEESYRKQMIETEALQLGIEQSTIDALFSRLDFERV
jgi:hypothetical protein